MARNEDFDTAYMRALFDYGYQQGLRGYPWRKTPIFSEPDGREDLLSNQGTNNNRYTADGSPITE